MRILFIFFAIVTLFVSANAQDRTTVRFGHDLLKSEIMKTEGALWVRQSGFASFSDDRPAHAYTAVGSEKDYTPHFASRVPGLRTFIRLTAGLNYVPLANGDAKFDSKAIAKNIDSYLARNGIDKNSDFARAMKDGFRNGEFPNFMLFAQARGFAGRQVEMVWNPEIGCYEGFMEITSASPDKYQWELTFGFRDMRERIKLTVPIIGPIFNFEPTINRPRSQYNEQAQASEFIICSGEYFTGIDRVSDLWKLTVYIRRATFESHGGTSWNEADTAGGYLAVIPVPPGFKPGMPVPGGASGKTQGLPEQILNSSVPGLPKRHEEPRRQVEDPQPKRSQELKRQIEKSDVGLTPNEMEPVTAEVFHKSVNGKDERALRVRSLSDYKISFSDGRQISEAQHMKSSQSIYILASAVRGYKEVLIEADDYTVVIDLALLQAKLGTQRRFKG